jgi:hypothetical protein
MAGLVAAKPTPKRRAQVTLKVSSRRSGRTGNLSPSANLGSHLYVRAWCVGVSDYYECPRGQGDANGYAAVVS